MDVDRCLTSSSRAPGAMAADTDAESPKRKKRFMRTEGVTSFAAVLLAFLATQHHNLHMLLLAVGIGGAGMSFMTMFPDVRRIMLVMSLAMVGMMVFRACDAKRSTSMRILNSVSVLVTLGLVAWSVSQFGL